jgi:hypothetical protein
MKATMYRLPLLLLMLTLLTSACKAVSQIMPSPARLVAFPGAELVDAIDNLFFADKIALRLALFTSEGAVPSALARLN